MTTQVPNQTSLRLVRLENGVGINVPRYETSGAAGMDICAAVPESAPVTLRPGERSLIPTGYVFEIPFGYEAQVRPRSGLAIKNGITCLNTPGTIDSDYRGEVKVILINLGQEDFVITRGMRIAQIVLAPITQMPVIEVSEVTETARGAGGFGSTGV
jgi:dUTP pyrophosphatase